MATLDENQQNSAKSYYKQYKELVEERQRETDPYVIEELDQQIGDYSAQLRRDGIRQEIVDEVIRLINNPPKEGPPGAGASGGRKHKSRKQSKKRRSTRRKHSRRRH